MRTGPFNREVSQTLHLRNPNPEPVAFKVCFRLESFYSVGSHAHGWQQVKTTAPKQYVYSLRRADIISLEPLPDPLSYCVRPNSGRIEPGKNVEVQGESWIASRPVCCGLSGADISV